MPKTFCHICGSITSDLYENKCQSCFIKEKSSLRLPKLSVRLCKECLRYLKRGMWKHAEGTFEEALKTASYHAMKESLNLEMENPRVDIQVGETVKTSNKVYHVKCSVRASGELSGIAVKGKADTNVKVTIELCRDCSRRAGGYYEAVLQLRGKADVIKSDEDEILNNLIKEQKVSLTRVKKLKGGADLYFISTQACRKSAKILLERYGGSLKESAKLHGVNKSGKNVYRVTISLRLPDFKKNDVIAFEGAVYQVLGFGREKISLFNLESRVKSSLPLKLVKGAEVLDGEVIKAMVLEAIPGKIQVMETKEYKTLEFYLQVPLEAKEEVNIFKNAKAFLLMTGMESQ